MIFAPGDEVVFVGGAPGVLPNHAATSATMKRAAYVFPRKGSHYVVREARACTLGEGLLLAEIVNPPVLTKAGIVEIAFWAPDFRPVRREAIEQFKLMAASTKPLVDIASGVVPNSAGQGRGDGTTPAASASPESFGTRHPRVDVGQRTPCGPGVAQTADTAGDAGRLFIRGAK